MSIPNTEQKNFSKMVDSPKQCKFPTANLSNPHSLSTFHVRNGQEHGQANRTYRLRNYEG